MIIKLLNVVVFAENYSALVSWYKTALGLEVLQQEEGEYNYTELGYEGKKIIGIAPANEVEHTPSQTRNNSTIMQLNVSDIKTLFKQVSDQGGKILFGPDADEKYNFQYGGVADIEGNQIWIVEES